MGPCEEAGLKWGGGGKEDLETRVGRWDIFKDTGQRENQGKQELTALG